MKIYVYTVGSKNISDTLTVHTKTNKLYKLKKKSTTSYIKYMKINKQGVLIRSGGLEKNRTINKHPATFIRNLRVYEKVTAFVIKDKFYETIILWDYTLSKPYHSIFDIIIDVGYLKE